MQRVACWFLVYAACLAGCKTVRHVAGAGPEPTTPAGINSDAAKPSVNYSDQITWLLGYFNPSQFSREPHSAWYIKGFNDYQPDTAVMNRLNDIGKDGISIKIVMGTWCPDSRREVPRFMKILDIWKFPLSAVTFIGVDDAKLSPVGEYTGLGIERVPTFIIYENNIEAGRIIENPSASLERDLVKILTSNEK
jgi:hypothetical protein